MDYAYLLGKGNVPLRCRAEPHSAGFWPPGNCRLNERKNYFPRKDRCKKCPIFWDSLQAVHLTPSPSPVFWLAIHHHIT